MAQAGHITCSSTSAELSPSPLFMLVKSDNQYPTSSYPDHNLNAADHSQYWQVGWLGTHSNPV